MILHSGLFSFIDEDMGAPHVVDVRPVLLKVAELRSPTKCRMVLV